MSKTIVRPTLSLGNHIYLYRLLRDAIGCGKQTFMTQVEEALAAGDVAAHDLGFESTRELLEELDDCIKLTVFKGGRLYATVIANDAWDAALAKGEDKPKTAKGAKQSYKKKKRGEKDLKAVRPKHVKRPEPETMVEAVPEPEPEAEIEVAIEVAAEAETEIAATTDPKAISEQEATAELDEAPKSTIEEATNQPETPAFQNSDVFGDEAEDDQSDEPADQDATESVSEPRHRSLPSHSRSSMTPRTQTPASPPWPPHRSRQSRLSRRRTPRKPMPRPRLKTHPSPWNRQIPQLSRNRCPSLHPSSSPHPHLSMTRFPHPHRHRLRSPLQYRHLHPQHRPSPRTSPSISQPKSSAPARFCTSCRPISPTEPTPSALSASTTGSPASAVPSRPRETAQASPCTTRSRRAPRSHRAHPPQHHRRSRSHLDHRQG